MRVLFLIVVLSIMVSSASAQEHVGHDAHSPYAADTFWTIKALSPDDVAGLLEGRGMGFARAAELNGYPGPLHVLELSEELNLSDMQRGAVEQIRGAMQAEAQALGAQVVAMEEHLDALFADARASPDEVDRMTMHAAEAKGRLRAVHLRAHIVTRSALTTEQVALYDRLRGYTTD